MPCIRIDTYLSDAFTIRNFYNTTPLYLANILTYTTFLSLYNTIQTYGDTYIKNHLLSDSYVYVHPDEL